jgi:poly(hydroxyalkanoate) depolymerase family esterase
MNFRTSIQDALNLTRSRRLMEATQRIQEALSGEKQTAKETPDQSIPSKYFGKVVRPLAQVVQTLQKMKQSQFALGKAGRLPSPTDPELVDGAKFLTKSFSCKAGSRSYKLYVPNHRADNQRPLLIMLHGCKQNPTDFAVGTRMNALAEAHGMLVAYPAQTQSANPSACWNWFNPSHQQPGMGEPAIIAGLTEEIIKSNNIDARKVFVAGLSAGGAMAVVMGETYPQLFSAVGVHSGLPYQCANDVVSAFAAMRGDFSHKSLKPKVRTVIFHGDADRTVTHSNGERIVSEIKFSPLDTDRGFKEGRQYTRRIFKDQNGLPIIEHWLIHGAGHAWSGGSPAGSYTDSSGPNASAEMTRFFFQGPESKS